jgi:hypothetical protein
MLRVSSGLTRIVETHVRPYLPDELVNPLDEKRLQDMSASLLVLQRTLEQEYARNLPDVTDEFGIGIGDWVQLKALVGDTSDNIPKLFDGVGPLRPS